jgi:hypothetical protein
MNQRELYNTLTRFGDCYELNIKGNTGQLMDNLKEFDNDWKPYNPRKGVNREGLSITSLDGGLSGIPDLDSVYEYNKVHSVKLNEHSFKTKTPVYQHCAEWLDFLGPHMSRTHLIRLHSGGYFPIHRDNKTIEITNFRLFVPIKNCGYPDMVFMLDRKVLNMNEGSVYFLDTCKEHLLFNAGINSTSTFMVINVELTEDAVRTVLRNMFAG